jgi:sulfur carrier protein ThiS
VKILLRNPRRELELPGPMTVHALLQKLEISPESVLVIVGDELVPRDARVDDSASVEIRPVISGGDGAAPTTRPAQDGPAQSTRNGGAV